MQRNLAAVAMRAENNKERFHWRERIAAPFEGNYSKHREHLKRSRAKRHAGGKLDLDQPCNTVVERRKKKKQSSYDFEGHFQRWKNHSVGRLQSPFLRGSNENIDYFLVTSNQKVEMYQSHIGN